MFFLNLEINKVVESLNTIESKMATIKAATPQDKKQFKTYTKNISKAKELLNELVDGNMIETIILEGEK